MLFKKDPRIIGNVAEPDKTAVALPIIGYTPPKFMEKETPKKTLFGDLKKRLFDDPDFNQHIYEDFYVSYEDNVNDALNNGWITPSQYRELMPKAQAKDREFLKYGPLAPLSRFLSSQYDNRFSENPSELSKKALKNLNQLNDKEGVNAK